MYRSILFLSMVLIVQSGYAENLWSINVPAIKEIALKAAYEQHPEIVPGDLTERDGVMSFYCFPVALDEPYHPYKECSAGMSFKISSTAFKEVRVVPRDNVPEGLRTWCASRDDGCCYELEIAEAIRVKVYMNGEVETSRVQGDSGGNSTECPEVH